MSLVSRLANRLSFLPANKRRGNQPRIAYFSLRIAARFIRVFYDYAVEFSNLENSFAAAKNTISDALDGSRCNVRRGRHSGGGSFFAEGQFLKTENLVIRFRCFPVAVFAFKFRLYLVSERVRANCPRTI